jgi:hypothetical protein
VEPEAHVLPPSPRPWPVLGPAVSVYAVLLWSFVVFGQLTTSWSMGTPLSGTVAGFAVLLLAFVAWIAGIRRGSLALPPRSRARLVGRAVGIAAASFVLWLATIFAATILGSESRRNHDLLVAFLLVVVSGVAALAGPRLTSPVRPVRTHRMRFALVMMWICGALVTLVAGVDLAANG